jgi:hypothetical protein
VVRSSHGEVYSDHETKPLSILASWSSLGLLQIVRISSFCPSGARRGDSGRRGDCDESGQSYLYEVEDHERQDTRREGFGGGEAGYHGKPGSAEGVDDREPSASPQEAGPQRPAAGGSRDGMCGEAGYRCGQRVGDQISTRRPEQDAETALEPGEDRHAYRANEDVNGLRERPVSYSEQEP